VKKPTVIVVGGGHNGLIAAAYLAKSGLDVTVFEKLPSFGGAAVSTQAFPGVPAFLSRYSYLVSLLPKQIIEDLDLKIELAPRRYSSFTPDPFSSAGLLIDKKDDSATKESFEKLGAADDYLAWNEFYSKTEQLAKLLFPTVLQPLKSASEVRELVGEDLWQEFFVQPIGQTIAESFENDLVRGVVMTDALIGTFAENFDETLASNKCFLYHVIGNETGDWNIPVGGMGSVSESMRQAALRFGAKLEANAEVTAIDGAKTVTYLQEGAEKTISADFILVNVAKPTLEKLLGRDSRHDIEGAQVKVNMLLKRLPKLKSGVDSEAAFGGTFHINENFSQLQTAFEQASKGEIPNPLPCEIYCHSLTDPTILGAELQSAGVQTLTVFALHTPHSLLANKNHAEVRDALQESVIASLNSVLAEDIRDLLLEDVDGNKCIETKTTQDLEDALGLPGGNIFHAPLSWPFSTELADHSNPASAWGVATGQRDIFYCGSSAVRGGAVSGIAGHNAAAAVLQILGAKH
jgi:phytoene dehydrogenase-like protein